MILTVQEMSSQVNIKFPGIYRLVKSDNRKRAWKEAIESWCDRNHLNPHRETTGLFLEKIESILL